MVGEDKRLNSERAFDESLPMPRISGLGKGTQETSGGEKSEFSFRED